MNVILTHEQADFDALGALLGAWLLDENSFAILPARLNRNVRRFLNLYGSELPFIDFRDFVAENVTKVTLVDTQSMVTLKGVNSKTSIQTIDHHPRRADLDDGWHVSLDKTGACTTLFVEQLHDLLFSLNKIQATLLLLGIYEDTGSLSYASTTARDIRAAAALVEAGASLRIASEFLNPALSDEQKQLADRLMDSIKTLDIHGKAILVASADGREMNDEVSSVAHKLRDLFDPDGLFLLIETRDGIRLVARSTSDQVNVARIAAVFEGGGHERAASALIDLHNPFFSAGHSPLKEVEEKLIQVLPEIIQPSITVGKIMSKRPVLITPEASLDEAERVFKRYGYEGFPVISDGKVVGLLTRRAVDRARSHRLKLNAGSLMEAGEYSVTTHDTIDKLEKIMASTGWGQIPVLDPITLGVIGIVTRTDLLKSLAQESSFVPGKINYSDLLKKNLAGPRLALIQLVAEEAATEHLPIYIVGGFVRDLILGRPSTDFDVVVEGEAIQLANRLYKRFGGRVIAHSRFGTAKWMIKSIKEKLIEFFKIEPLEAEKLPDSLDLISARTEFYDHPTALPTVERSSIKLDLHRRDFTINTMALRLDGRHFGELYDYWDGLTDLQKKQVKVLHSLSFVDDPTRLLRAVRFEQRFHFKIENRTLQLMDEARPLFKQVSGDRLRHEINLIFKEANPFQILERLQKLNLLQTIHPALVWKNEYKPALNQALFGEIPNKWLMPSQIGHTSLRLALVYLVWLIPHGEKNASEIAARLHLNNTLIDSLIPGCRIWEQKETWDNLQPSDISDRLLNITAITGYALFLMSPVGKFKENLQNYYTKWKLIFPITDGNRLKEMGLLPGPQYSEIIHHLRSAWINGDIKTVQQEETLLNEITHSLRHQDK